jgi:DNA (cytosine-5)-methyltransferase 1
MKYLSVCSGIEAATVAWHGLGWKAAAYSEIEPFPSAVLAHHYPDVPNVGDMTKFKEWNIEPGSIDLLVGGTPCQSFSVAGLRKGLDDPRGNLMLTYLAIARQYRPRWLVWENVPGVLSSNGGLDFASLLRGMGECGYGFAYRILDAQYFGVPQRRRRVFVIGYLGNWRAAAAVLFERHSLSGHPAPSREKGQGITHATAPCLTSSGRGVERTGETRGQDPVIAVSQPYPIANTLTARMHKGINSTVDEGQTPVMQPIPLNSMNALRDANADPSTGCGIGEAGEAMFTITKGHSHAVAFEENFHAIREVDIAPAMTTEGYRVSQNAGGLGLQTAMQVRRLTPVECERLQGFPDNYTAIPWRKKPADECPDGPRYKALGNSMAVPVMAWIGKRIQEFEAMNAS